MTEQQQETTETPTDQDQNSPADREQPSQEPRTQNEAAKYRVRLRETETERDALAAKVQKYQWAEVQRHLDRIENTEVLQRLGHDLQDFLNEDGEVDPERVTTISSQAADDLGIPKPNNAPRMPLEGRAPSYGTETPRDVQQALRTALGIK